jgi:hypothetical protein
MYRILFEKILIVTNLDFLYSNSTNEWICRYLEKLVITHSKLK